LIEISGSFIWINIIPTNGGFNDILQLGIGVCRGGIECSDQMHYQAARGREKTTPGCSGFTNEYPIGHRLAYWNPGTWVLELKHTGNYWVHKIDGIEFELLSESWVCWTPRKAVWFAESLDTGDALGGSTLNPYLISNARYTTTEGGSWSAPSWTVGPSCNYADGPAPFGCEVAGASAINVWTQSR
jgi:hypothetical protein